MELKLPYPPSTNRMWRTRVVMARNKKSFSKTYLTKEAEDFKGMVKDIAGDLRPLDGDICVGLVLAPRLTKKNEASKVLMDLDNSIKVTLDALIGIAYVDDKQVKRITAEYGQPEVGGALYVTVREMECLSE